MIKFILTTLLLVALVTPAHAAWWDTKETFLCVSMTDILISNPDIPYANGVDLEACWATVDGQPGQPTQGWATLIWTTGADGDYLYRETYPLAPGDLVINAKLTKAHAETAERPDHVDGRHRWRSADRA